MSPRVIGANLAVSLKTFSREKSAMFFTIAFPIILILVFGTIFLHHGNETFDLHVQDLDRLQRHPVSPSALRGVSCTG